MEILGNVDWIAVATFLLAIATFILMWQTTYYRRKDLKNSKIDEAKQALHISDAWNSEAIQCTEEYKKDLTKLIELKERMTLISSTAQQEKLDAEKRIEIATKIFQTDSNRAEIINDKSYEVKRQLSGIEPVINSLKDQELVLLLEEFNEIYSQTSVEVKAMDNIDKTNMSQLDKLKILLQRNETVLKYVRRRKEIIDKMVPRLESLKK